MKKLFIGLLVVFQLSATAPTIRLSEVKQLKEYDFLPMEVPLSSENTYTTDVYLTFIRLTNTTDSTRTVTVIDGSGAPVAILSEVPIAARTTFTIFLAPSWMPSGVKWVASGAGVIGYMRGLK